MPSINSGSSSTRFRNGSLMACLVTAAMAAGPAEAQLTQLAQSIRDFDKDLPATAAALPTLLSQTGLYKNIGNKATRALTDTNAIVAFEVNSALWSDGSHKERFIAVPAGMKVTPNDSGKYIFPDNTVMIKNFAVDTVYGDSTTRIYVETRFQVYQSTATEKKWSGFTYRWLRNQTDAVLVSTETGLDTTIAVKLNGSVVGKRWRYPSTSDCAQCHIGEETEKRGSLGFITPQLNRMIGSTNQMARLVTKNVLASNPVATKTLPRWYGLKETSASLEQRARSYLASNCSHCHGNNVLMSNVSHNFDYFNPAKKISYTDDPDGGWVSKPPQSGGEYPSIVHPGSPDSSLLMRKMMNRFDTFIMMSDPAQMPPLATSQVDSAAVLVMRDWICSLKPGTTTCKNMAWLPDDVNWDSVQTAVSIHGFGARRNPTAEIRLRAGLLTMPAALAASGTVELRDSQGRSIPLVPAGAGQFRLPSNLRAGAFLFRAGKHSTLLHYLP